MTREEARIHLINWIEFATNSEKHPFLDEPCSDEEILEAMQLGADALCPPHLPSNLDEAAENIYKVPFGTRAEDFKAGAECMAGQGETIEGEVMKDIDNNLCVTAKGFSGKEAKFADKVVAQIRKK